ncbi:MAG: M12 family metallopeptidase [Verrucomicrobiales bacterium]|nr:M12 family metallopeptidase [Verrucomicrobiales bacterium]
MILTGAIINDAQGDEPGAAGFSHASWVCDAHLPASPRVALHSPFPNLQTRFWPNGRIPYEFEEDITADEQSAMLDAMRVWEDAIGVNFAPRGGDEGYVTITAHPESNTGDYEGAGYYGARSHRLRVGKTAWTRGLLLHELGHALGFWHTQSRRDRTGFVRIESANILEGRADQFDRVEDSLPYGEYDFASIMHYRACQLSTCGGSSCIPTDANCRTITVLPPYDKEWQSKIGRSAELSEMDKLTMSFIYAPTSWIFLNQNSPNFPGRGTFFDAFRLFVDAESFVPENGVLICQPGTYAAGEFHRQAMTIKAPLGGVTLTK